MITLYELYKIYEEDEKFTKLKLDVYDKSFKTEVKTDKDKNAFDKDAVNKQLNDSKLKLAALKKDLDDKHKYMQDLLVDPNIINDEKIKKSAEDLKSAIEEDTKKYEEMVKLFDDQMKKLNQK